MDLFERAADFTALRGKKVLCLGLGGGADAISAYACAAMAEAAGAVEAHYANTKREPAAELRWRSEHVGVVDGPPVPLDRAVRSGSIDIERSLPRGAGGSPLVVTIPREPSDALLKAIGAELGAPGYDALLGIDTGGDVLRRKGRARSRDWQALRALASTGHDPLVVVLGLGSDGVSPEALTRDLPAARSAYLGHFPLAPWRAPLERASVGLAETRTVRIILGALESSAPTILVPRGSRARVDRRWLIHGFVFRGAELLGA
ncbi:MAG: hypothetical protein R3B09_06065 [Nannocystaceae bacterium]